MIYNIIILSLLMSLDVYAVTDEKNKRYTKSEYLKKDIQEYKEVLFVTQESIQKYTRMYGKAALRRLVHIDSVIKELKDASLYKKLSTIDKLVNKLHFMPHEKHWGKENYWATPLETIGSNYGDTEAIALLKFVLMVQVGIDPQNMQLIKKNIPFKRKNKIYEENVSLFYFTKNHINPLVIDYDYRGGKIYKYEDQFEFDFIKESPNKEWNIIFKKNITNSDIVKIMNYSDN